MNNVSFEKTPIIDLFVSVQGEGSLVGKRSIFVRTSGCNLRCKFANSICDTPYSSYVPEQGKFSIEDVVSLIEKDNARHIVLTGGEPTLYPDFIKWLKMSFPNHHLTIETNGTIPLEKQYIGYIDLASISPKLISSIDPEDKFKEQRKISLMNIPSVVKSWLHHGHADVQLKYVVANEQDVLHSIAHLKAIEYCIGESIDRDWVYLMPAGSTFEELCQTRPIVGELAIKYGFSLTDRMHFNFFGNKREA